MTLFLLSIFLVCSILSCTKTDVTPGKTIPQNENILRYDVNAPFTSLNPTEVFCSGSNNVFPLLYSYLFVPNLNGALEPDLATKWTYDPMNLTWTIHLRKDALFHNKHSVTSKDVKYSFETRLTKKSTSISSIIKHVTLLSNTVLCIHLRKDDPEFLKKIWDFEIVPAPGRDKIDYYNHPIGSGPFRFAYRNGDKEVVLVANEKYHDGRPSLDGIVFHYQPEKEKAWTRLLSGKTDIVQEISPENYEMTVQYEKRFYFNTYILRFYTILLYNTTDPLFSDPRVRLALTNAIDRGYIVEKILKGCGVVAVGPLGAGSPYHNPEVKPIPYSPEKALELLQEAGLSYDKEGQCLLKKGKPFEFTILVYHEHQIEKEIAQYIKLCLNDIGIKVNLQSLPYEDLKRRYWKNTEFQAVITEFSSHCRTPEYLQHMWAPDCTGKSRCGCFEHPKVTNLMNKVLDEKNPLKQKKLFYELDTLIASLQPGTFLFHKTAIDVMSKRFALPFPFTMTYHGIYHLKYASLNRT